MKKQIKTVLFTLLALPGLVGHAADKPSKEEAKEIATIKQERNFIVEGNKLYRNQRFAEAEVLYRKALEVAPGSETAAYNLAASLIRQAGSADPNAGNNPMQEAQALLSGLAKNATDVSISEKAYYNLGNMSFNKEDYAQSIEMYKNSLRKNPDNDLTRENLRLAQLKKKEQDQNKDKNQDKNQDQQNQDQKQQDQQKNPDQNQQNQDQNQDQQQQQQDKDKDKKQDRQQQQSISQSNADKILKAMENEEAATRRRIEAQQRKNAEGGRRHVTKPW